MFCHDTTHGVKPRVGVGVFRSRNQREKREGTGHRAPGSLCK